MYATLCSNTSIPVNIEKVDNVTPFTSTLKKIIADAAIDSILNTIKGIKANNHAYVVAVKQIAKKRIKVSHFSNNISVS